MFNKSEILQLATFNPYFPLVESRSAWLNGSLVQILNTLQAVPLLMVYAHDEVNSHDYMLTYNIGYLALLSQTFIPQE